MPIARRTLYALILLWLIQLFIRAHNITVLPIFTDENAHIGRAAEIYSFQHPALNSHGKFLFYFVPGIFDIYEWDTALHLSRTAVALSSLLTTAMIFLIVRHFVSENAGLVGVAFYVFAPFAFFFERMALADAWAGFIATVTVWMALRFTEHPNKSRAFWLGTFMAATLAAKLTMAFVVMIPAVTILLIGHYHNWRDLWARYGRLSIRVNLVVIGWWLLVFIPAAIGFAQGMRYLILDTPLIASTALTITLPEKFEQMEEKLRLLVSLPMFLLMVIGVVFALRRYPRRTLIVLAWLFLAWLPTFVVVRRDAFQSRYLMAGMPAMAALFGMGVWVLLMEITRKRQQLALALAAFLIGVWVALFAAPFAVDAYTDPTRLDLPAQDTKDYIYNYYNGYALIDALDDLEARDEETTLVMLNTRFCMPNLYGWERIQLDCATRRSVFEPTDFDPIATTDLEAILRAEFEQVDSLYVVSIVYHRDNLPDDAPFNWEWINVYQKPHRPDYLITVWRVTPE